MTTLDEIRNIATVELYTNDNKRHTVADTLYRKTKTLTTGFNTRKITPTKRRLQNIIGTWALLNNWLCHSWKDGKGPTDHYFDITLAKNNFMFFVYIHGKTIKLNQNQSNWCKKASAVNMSVYHWNIQDLNNIRRLLYHPEPTQHTANFIFPPPKNTNQQ